MCRLLSRKPPWFSRHRPVPVFPNMLEPEPEEIGSSTRPRVENKEPAEPAGRSSWAAAVRTGDWMCESKHASCEPQPWSTLGQSGGARSAGSERVVGAWSW